uniref:DOMON domain-containing protein n=1 Tax=Syphacia muris TaxID=451379 RepID=A0A0N5ABA5_9BILA
LFVAGKIIPRQEPTVHTKTTRSKPLTLLIGALENLDGNGKASSHVTLSSWSASGEMYYDDGDSIIDIIGEYKKLCFLEFKYAASGAVANLSISRGLCTDPSEVSLNEIVVFGQRSAASNLRLSGVNVNASFPSDEVYGTYTIKLDKPLSLKGVELAWDLEAMTPTAVPTTNSPPFTTSSAIITTSESTFHVVLFGLAALLYSMF